MIKFFDCSLNNEYSHRSISLGPKENDIMKDLKEFSQTHNFSSIDNYKYADIIITNTIFTKEILKHSLKNNIPLIKRMDGIFWKNSIKERNELLNNSAVIADQVIFISKFSQKSFHTLYPKLKLKNETVILNNANNRIFYKKQVLNDIIWCSSCTNWERTEKRFNDILKFADILEKDNKELYLIGNCQLETPKNIIKLGYFNDYEELSNTMSNYSAFVNLSYRDAGSKVCSQALNSGLPVLYANSGGVPELIDDYGISIKDNQEISFNDEEYELNYNDILESYNKFKNDFSYLQSIIKPRNYNTLIKDYFDTFKKFL